MIYSYLSRTEVGLKRFDNEDAIGIQEISGGLLAIVCDGLGGNKAGEVASNLAIETVINDFIEIPNSIDWLEKIRISLSDANKAVYEKSISNFEYKGMATTAEVLFLKDDSAYWGHVGDSRIYLFKNNKIQKLTKDHSLVQKLLDEGYLTIKEAENHPNKNIIMRAVGEQPDLDIDLSKQKNNNNDQNKYFLCSDGVTAVINDEELQDILRNTDLEVISDTLYKLIIERGAPDNFSFIIISTGE